MHRQQNLTAHDDDGLVKDVLGEHRLCHPGAQWMVFVQMLFCKPACGNRCTPLERGHHSVPHQPAWAKKPQACPEAQGQCERKPSHSRKAIPHPRWCGECRPQEKHREIDGVVEPVGHQRMRGRVAVGRSALFFDLALACLGERNELTLPASCPAAPTRLRKITAAPPRGDRCPLART